MKRGFRDHSHHGIVLSRLERIARPWRTSRSGNGIIGEVEIDVVDVFAVVVVLVV